MKNIGFIDYYLSEWHANNYPAWIDNACRELGLEYRVAYAWGEKTVSPVDGTDSTAWCKAHGVTLCQTIEEVCEKSDVLLVLAPSDPQTHLGYAERVLPFGKRTYIDKTFAPDAKTAQKIFELADRYGAPVFSSSALRYADELANFTDVRSLLVTGGGSNAPEYIIHQAEMVIKLLGEAPTAVTCDKQGTNQLLFRADFASGAKATMIFAPSLPYTLCSESTDGTSRYAAVQSDMFGGLIRDILRFYETGIPSFEREQTMFVMQLRDAALRASVKASV